MNTNELVDIIHALEGSNPNLNQYEALEQIGFYDERDDILYSRLTGQPFDNSHIARNIYSEDEIKMINSWAQMLGEDNFSSTPFCERTFLRNFLASIPESQQMDYIKNTNLYYGKNSSQADPKFVLVTRRTLPSKEPKSEKFWSEEPTTTFWGLRHEIAGIQRAYSSIMVSTLGNLQDHGGQDIELLSSGVSDGEIVTSNRPFPHEKVLFAYKPLDELSTLLQTTKNPSQSYDDFLSRLTSVMQSRYAEINSNYNSDTIEQSSSENTAEFSIDDWL